MGKLGHLGRTYLVGKPHRDGVDGARQGVGHGHRSGEAAAVVGRRPAAKADRPVVAQVLGFHPSLQGCGVDEGLEGRAWLAERLGRPVEGAGPVVAPPYQGPDRPVRRQGHQGGLGRAELAPLRHAIAHHLGGDGLQVRVHRQGHHQVRRAVLGQVAGA